MADIELPVAEEYLHAEDHLTVTVSGIAPVVSLILLLLFLSLWLFG